MATLGKWWQPWAAQRSHWFRLSFIEVKYAAKVVFICELFLFNWFCWFRIKNIINYAYWIHFNMLHIDKHNTLECARKTNMCRFHWIMATTNGGDRILVVAIIYLWWQTNILGHMPNVASILTNNISMTVRLRHPTCCVSSSSIHHPCSVPSLKIGVCLSCKK